MLPSKARIIKNKLETAGADIKRDKLPLASMHHAKFWTICTDPLMRGLQWKTNIIKRKKTANYGNELARINNKEGYVNTHLPQPLRLHLTRPPSDQFPFKHFSYYTSVYDDFGSADSRKFRFTCQMRAQCLLRLKACQRHLWNSQFCVWRLTTVPVERTR